MIKKEICPYCSTPITGVLALVGFQDERNRWWHTACKNKVLSEYVQKSTLKHEYYCDLMKDECSCTSHEAWETQARESWETKEKF